jgi:hypothetical protein
MIEGWKDRRQEEGTEGQRDRGRERWKDPGVEGSRVERTEE